MAANNPESRRELIKKKRRRVSLHLAPAAAKQNIMASHAKTARPRIVSEFEIDESFGYLETSRFTDYCKFVRRMIDRAKSPMSYGDMRRAMGGNFVDRMHADALEYLEADGVIRQLPSGSLTRYEPALRHERNERKMSFSITPPSSQAFATALLD
jgi:hypothetical protein